MDSLPIHSAQGDYQVDFISSIKEVVDLLENSPKALLVIDDNVGRLYEKEFAKLFDKIPTYRVTATEESKTLEGVGKLCLWLQAQNATKQTRLLVVGGGITQDLCTFSAHIYYRGIHWTFIPTTLLSMCDSCIGAKCGINLGSFKNQLGIFQSPSRVIVCDAFVKTLTDECVASGYGEILKLAITGSEERLNVLMGIVEKEGLRNGSLLALIRDSLVVKKKVIEEDEYEKDYRRVLNYGHSFGHALESITHHEICHGLAVAWGLDLINFISWKRGHLSESGFKKVHSFIKKVLPFQLSKSISLSDLISGAKRDKKVADSAINLVLNFGSGNLKIVKTPFDRELENQIGEYLEEHNVYYCH